MLWPLTSIAFGLVFLAGTLLTLTGQLRAYPLMELARDIKASDTLFAAPADRQIRIRAISDANRKCETRIASSRVTAALFLLRRAIADQAPIEVREDRFLYAQAAVNWALACSPLDGNLWLVAATLDRVASYEPERFRDFITLSIRTTPYEGPILERRWRELAPLVGEKNVPIFDAALSSDLDHALELVPSPRASAFVTTLRATGSEAIAAAALARLPAERVAALRTAETRELMRRAKAARTDRYFFSPFGAGR